MMEQASDFRTREDRSAEPFTALIRLGLFCLEVIMGKVVDLTGQRFGRLLVVKRVENNKHRSARWLCECDCGESAIIVGKNLRIGDTKSCGCHKKEQKVKQLTKHGKHGTPEYRVWKGMNTRCFGKRNPSYHNYGGRGITICDRWKNSFENFFSDMGQKPSPNHSIDRINNDGNYEPGNCRWATKAEQSRNRRGNINITHPETGETLCAAEWSRRLGGGKGAVRRRIVSLGWSHTAAILTPARALLRPEVRKK